MGTLVCAAVHVLDVLGAPCGQRSMCTERAGGPMARLVQKQPMLAANINRCMYDQTLRDAPSCAVVVYDFLVEKIHPFYEIIGRFTRPRKLKVFSLTFPNNSKPLLIRF